MASRLTQKQEIFCLKYIELGNVTQAALLAGYSPKTAQVIGSENLSKPMIISRIQELRQAAEDATVATVLERKQVLTEITRGRFADFVGKGLTSEKLRSAALQEIKVTEFSAGETSTKKTTIRLHSPIQAIAELNKMDGIYREGMTVNIDNRRLEITVSSEKTRELLGEIEKGVEPHGNES